MYCLYLIVLLCALNAWGISIDDPTPEEIKKGFVIQPWASWGQQARQQNSLRILCIGGSNTANKYHNNLGYVELLDSYIRTSLPGDDYFKSNSYAWNRGVSGMSIIQFTGRLYNFELNTSLSEWPNVVIIDCRVNMPANINQLVTGLEKVVRSIVFKYKLKGFPSPDFMFYNMPHLKPMYGMGQLKNRSERSKYVSTYRKNEFEADKLIKQFATFYHFPILSWGEATYDAATRHFIEYGFNDPEHRWPYSVDGIHMSPDGGTQLGTDQLLGPFFTSVMKSRKEGPLKDVSQWPRMYPASNILMEILSYTSYYYSVNVFRLTDAVHNLEHSEWKKVSVSHLNYCFGSTVQNSVGELRFTVPEICNTVDCRIKLAFLHSWNTSYIGDAQCNLRRHDSPLHSGTTTRLANVTINGQEDATGATIPVESAFEGVSVKEGLHSVRCTNLIEGLLSCMTGLNVNAIVQV